MHRGLRRLRRLPEIRTGFKDYSLTSYWLHFCITLASHWLHSLRRLCIGFSLASHWLRRLTIDFVLALQWLRICPALASHWHSIGFTLEFTWASHWLCRLCRLCRLWRLFIDFVLALHWYHIGFILATQTSQALHWLHIGIQMGIALAFQALQALEIIY